MRYLLWTLCFLGIALWSLVAWAATGLIGSAEAWVPSLVGDPIIGISPAVADLAVWLGPAGTIAVIVVWAVGVVAMLLGTALVLRVGRAIRRRSGSNRVLGAR